MQHIAGISAALVADEQEGRLDVNLSIKIYEDFLADVENGIQKEKHAAHRGGQGLEGLGQGSHGDRSRMGSSLDAAPITLATNLCTGLQGFSPADRNPEERV